MSRTFFSSTKNANGLAEYLQTHLTTLLIRLEKCDVGSVARAYVESAINKEVKQGSLREQLLVDTYRAELEDEQGSRWNSHIEFYAQISEELALARGEWAKGDDAQALAVLDEIETSAQSAPVKALAWLLAAEILLKTYL